MIILRIVLGVAAWLVARVIESVTNHKVLVAASNGSALAVSCFCSFPLPPCTSKRLTHGFGTQRMYFPVSASFSQ